MRQAPTSVGVITGRVTRVRRSSQEAARTQWGPRELCLPRCLETQHLKGALTRRGHDHSLRGLTKGAMGQFETFRGKRKGSLCFSWRTEQQERRKCRIQVRRVLSSCYNNPLCFKHSNDRYRVKIGPARRATLRNEIISRPRSAAEPKVLGRLTGEAWGSPRARGGWEGSFLTIKHNESSKFPIKDPGQEANCHLGPRMLAGQNWGAGSPRGHPQLYGQGSQKVRIKAGATRGCWWGTNMPKQQLHFCVTP